MLSSSESSESEEWGTFHEIESNFPVEAFWEVMVLVLLKSLKHHNKQINGLLTDEMERASRIQLACNLNM